MLTKISKLLMIKSEDAPKLSHNEILKINDPTLGGTIAETLADSEADRFSDDDTQFLKFHGIYQQDDRDVRKTGKHFMFMVRGRIPGGIVPPDLYLLYDKLSSDYANNTLRITSRQSFQFHGIVKEGLGKLMKGINDKLSDTLAACGDVNRNVMAPTTPAISPLISRMQEDAAKLSTALLPVTKAYHQIWVEGTPLKLTSEEKQSFEDPLYGKQYLPRKFKAAFAFPPLNDVDIFTNCLGFVAIVENGELTGYNLLAGGGLGMSHGNAETFPRKADVIGFLTPDQLVDVGRAVLTIHRDFGDRTNRKHARLKYVLEDRGVEWFREELGKRLGAPLPAPKPFAFEKQGDLFGWSDQTDGKKFLGLHVTTGRVKDEGSRRLKTALRLIVEKYRLEMRLTPSQNLILANVDPAQQDEITAILAEHGVAVENQATPLHAQSMACPALPTCGLALAESERYLPSLIDEIEEALKQTGLEGEEIVVRMTGCPNGCARPYMAEIGFVGRAPNKYQIYLGGNGTSTRLNRLYKQSIKTDQILEELKPLFERFKAERQAGERFGDFCDRVVLPEMETAGA